MIKNAVLAEKLIIILVIFLFTFPSIQPDYIIGLDSSYSWALNYLFHNDYNTAKQFVYPIGVLGFLKMPTIEGYNLIYSLVFYSVVKLWFITSFLAFSLKFKQHSKLSAIAIVSIISFFCNIDFLIIGICTIQTLIYLEQLKIKNIALAVCLAYIGLCIKSSIGIAAFSIIFMSFCIDFYSNKAYKNSIQFFSCVLGLFLLLSLLVYQNLQLGIQQCIYAIKISLSYSDALSLHPANNWYVLTGFVLLICSLPFLFKDRNSRVLFLLLLPTFFIIWKHSMSREDISHSSVMICFLILFWGLFIIYSNNEIKKIGLTAAVSILLFYSNMPNIAGFKGYNIEICGINNFVTSVIHYHKFKEENTTNSINNVKPNKLDENSLKIIGNKSVDCYPWELSYIPANNLNWKPRKTLQSGSFSRWLDALNAEDFNRKNGPDYLIFHLVKGHLDNGFSSIDGRYLLNDNPITIFNILNNYSINSKTDNYLLFHKNMNDNFSQVFTDKNNETSWNTWIDIPNVKAEILRLKLFTDVSIIGKIKNFLFKSDIYYIDYLFDDGKILTFRYIPENGKDGIWINPFIQFPATNVDEPKVIKTRVKCSSYLFNKTAVNYQFEHIKINSNLGVQDKVSNTASVLFKKTALNADSLLVKRINTFDSQNNKNNNCISYSGYYQKIEPNCFSYTYHFTLDSIWKAVNPAITNINIEAFAMYLNQESKANFIITTSGTINDFWASDDMENNADKLVWQPAYTSKILSRRDSEKGKLTIYVWNAGTHPIYIDDFRISIKTHE